MNDLLCAADGGDVAFLLLLDLSAAFDTINHKLLLQRLHEEVGITDAALRWFTSYLSERFQKVVVGDAQSALTPLLCGVPQGSVLGPILFTLYTRQLGQLIDAHCVNRHQFADDSQLYKGCKPNPDSIQETLKTLQTCSSDIKKWMTNNKLKLNDDKTEALLCGSKPNLDKIELDKVPVADSEIPLSKSVRDLGLIIDSELSMEDHINSTVKTCFYHLRLLGKIRPLINQQTANTIAVSLVHSRLDYCNSALYGLPESQLKRLQRVQNVAARIVTRTRKRDSISPILAKLHWLPMELRIQHKVLSLVYACMREDSAPAYLSELITSYAPARTLRSSSQSRLSIPGYHDSTRKKRFGSRCFKCAAPKLCNSLPSNLKASVSIDSFKKQLQTHLFPNL